MGVIAYRLLGGSFPFASEIFDDEPGENVVGSPAMKAIQAKLCQAYIGWDNRAFRDDPVARHLWERALSMNQQLRPTAVEALADPWFAPSQLSSDVHWTAAAPIISWTRCDSVLHQQGTSVAAPKVKSISRSQSLATASTPVSSLEFRGLGTAWVFALLGVLLCGGVSGQP